MASTPLAALSSSTRKRRLLDGASEGEESAAALIVTTSGEQLRVRDSPNASLGGLSLPGLLERQLARSEARSSDVWMLFARQEEALQALNNNAAAADANTAITSNADPVPATSAPASTSSSASASSAPSATSLHLFSHELSGSSGAREFIVASYSSFYRRYMALPARHRHHYEVILHRQRQSTAHTVNTQHSTLCTHTQPQCTTGSGPGSKAVGLKRCPV